MKYILDIAIIVAIIIITWWGVLYSMDKRAVYQCHTWQVYAETYRTWYATNYERSQCAYYGIELPADRVDQ